MVHVGRGSRLRNSVEQGKETQEETKSSTSVNKGGRIRSKNGDYWYRSGAIDELRVKRERNKFERIQ